MNVPVILFCFNRPRHLEKTLTYLSKNKECLDTDLIVFSDGPRKLNTLDYVLIQDVRRVLNNVKGFKSITIHKSKENIGLAESIIKGLNEVFELNYNSVIVLEDDILVSDDFLSFMNASLGKYGINPVISSVSGYSFMLENCEQAQAVNLIKRASSWGWGTWRDRWMKVDWLVNDFNDFRENKLGQEQFVLAGKDALVMLYKQQKGEISSWAIRWTYFHYSSKSFCLVPKYSLVKNIGTDGSGTNFSKEEITTYNTDLHSFNILELYDEPKPSFEVLEWIKNKFKPRFVRRVINKLKYGVF